VTTPLEEAVTKSQELAALEAVAPACSSIRPMLELIRAGEYRRAWHEHSWASAWESGACEVAYDRAWDILWPINQLLHVVEHDPEGSVIDLSLRYGFLEEAGLKMVPSQEFERAFESAADVCDVDEGGYLWIKNYDGVCQHLQAELERAARFSSFAGRTADILASWEPRYHRLPVLSPPPSTPRCAPNSSVAALRNPVSVDLYAVARDAPFVGAFEELGETCVSMDRVLLWLRRGRYEDAYNQVTWVLPTASEACRLAVERGRDLLGGLAELERLLCSQSEPMALGAQLKGISHLETRSLALRLVPPAALQGWLEDVEDACTTKRGVTALRLTPYAREPSCLEAVADFEANAQGSTFAGRARWILRRERLNDARVWLMIPEMTRLVAAHEKVCSWEPCRHDFSLEGPCRSHSDNLPWRDEAAWKLDERWRVLINSRIPEGRRRELLQWAWMGITARCTGPIPIPGGE
jgi:hypothetical protein